MCHECVLVVLVLVVVRVQYACSYVRTGGRRRRRRRRRRRGGGGGGVRAWAPFQDV